jgi:hypothetical protein
MESKSPKPWYRNFMTSRLLSPSTRTAVSAPGRPPEGKQPDEAQRAVIGEADADPHARASEARAVPGAADTRWPKAVRTAWESYRQARVTAVQLAADYEERYAAGPDTAETEEAFWQGINAVNDAEVAYQDYEAARDRWHVRPEVSAEPDEPEAAS